MDPELVIEMRERLTRLETMISEGVIPKLDRALGVEKQVKEVEVAVSGRVKAIEDDITLFKGSIKTWVFVGGIAVALATILVPLLT